MEIKIEEFLWGVRRGNAAFNDGNTAGRNNENTEIFTLPHMCPGIIILNMLRKRCSMNYTKVSTTKDQRKGKEGHERLE